MKFTRFLIALAITCTLCGVAQAASVIAPDLNSPLAPALNLAPPTSNAASGSGSLTLGVGPSGDTTVSWFNDDDTLLRNSTNTPLSQGLAGTNQDGMLVQLGYFTAGTIANNFAGDFIPLTIGTRIGDSASLSGEGAGRVGFQTFFSLGSNVVNVFDGSDPGTYATNSFVTITSTTPVQDQVLAIRFFDTTTGTTGFFNTVSVDTWLWQSPTQLGATVVLDMGAVFDINPALLEWQDAANPFKTSLVVVPEPSSAAIVLVGGLLSFAVRRRRD